MQHLGNSPKWVLITGCSSGIGLEAAMRLKSAGYEVVASARKVEDVRRLRSYGLHAVQIDTADQDSVRHGVEKAMRMSGGVFYGIFHNAGYAASGALEDLPTEAMVEEFHANVFGSHEINRLLIPAMRKAGSGRIIYCSSVLGFVAMRFRGAYVASKFAMEGLADTLRLELKGSGIEVSLIEPGPIATNFRVNSLASFRKHIDVNSSAHRDAYQAFIERLAMPGPTTSFTLHPSSCVDALEHALSSAKPRIRYRVTTPTKVMAWLKRMLPTKTMDAVAQRGF